MKLPKIFIGPMSKNVVDTVIQLNKSIPIALIPSRRQIEANRGYVNNWDTLNFRNYVKSANPNVLICRDHAGPGQGTYDSSLSLKADCLCFDMVHIDPFKMYQNMEDAATKTILLIQECYQKNPQLQYEIGTEEAIFKYEPAELDKFIQTIQKILKPEEFKQIKYAVVQSGTGLDLPNCKNTGTFNAARLKEFIQVVHKYNLLSKEHNGDYLIMDGGIHTRFNDCGLDAINIAPEFGQLETKVILDYLKSYDRKDLIDKWYDICLASDKWQKWAEGRTLTQTQVIMTAGHYTFSDIEFKKIKYQFPEIDIIIKSVIKDRINGITAQAEKNYSN